MAWLVSITWQFPTQKTLLLAQVNGDSDSELGSNLLNVISHTMQSWEHMDTSNFEVSI